MASYPGVPMALDSERQPISLTRLNVTGTGTVRGTNSQTRELFRFRVLHRYISQADAQSIYANWQANKALPVDLTWKDGNTYSVIYDGPPRVDRIKGGWWQAEASLTGGPL
jgi:hypothetical protein